jgi:hypothetical protein
MLPPIITNNSSLLVFVEYSPSGVHATSSFEVTTPLDELSIFGASAAIVNVSGGCFGQRRAVREHFTDLEGRTSVIVLGPAVSWRMRELGIGEQVRWSLTDEQ